jgi:hypothetical protein
MVDPEKQPEWGSTYRLVASERWKAKSAAMGRSVTEAIVAYARPGWRQDRVWGDDCTGFGREAMTRISFV